MKIWNVTLNTTDDDLTYGDYCGIAETCDDAVKEAKKLAHISSHDVLNELVEKEDITSEDMDAELEKISFYASKVVMIGEVGFGL